MAELIDKGVLIKDWKKLPVQKVELVSCDDIYRNRPLCDLALVYEMITNAPTTTESEIRAKAYEIFIIKLCEVFAEKSGEIKADGITYDILTLDSAMEIMWDVAEQLKEE